MNLTVLKSEMSTVSVKKMMSFWAHALDNFGKNSFPGDVGIVSQMLYQLLAASRTNIMALY